MGVARVRSRAPRVARLAAVLLPSRCPCSPRPRPARRSGRSSSASPRDSSMPGPPGDGRRPGPNRALHAQVAGHREVPGHLRLERRDRFIGGLASKGIRALPFAWGSPKWVGNGDPRHPPLGRATERQAWQNFLKAAVARYGPGGAYWAPGEVRPGLRIERHAAADPVVAGLERAQSEEVLQPGIDNPAGGQ